MEEIGLQFRTMFAELVQQSLDDRFIEDFSTDGSFFKITVRPSFWVVTQFPHKLRNSSQRAGKTAKVW